MRKNAPPQGPFVGPLQPEPSIRSTVEALNNCSQLVDEHGTITFVAIDEITGKPRDIHFIEPLILHGMDEFGLQYDYEKGIVRLSREVAKMLKPFGLHIALSEQDIDQLQEIMMEAQPEMGGTGWSARAGIASRKRLAPWMEEIRNRPSERESSGIHVSER